MTKFRHSIAATVALGATLVLGGPAFSQSADLIKKAQEEGQLTWYTTTPTSLLEQYTSAFKDKYGIEVTVFRGGGAQIAQKLALELRARKVEADVVDLSDPSVIHQLNERKAIAPYEVENAASLPESLKAPDHTWTAYSQHIFPIIYNKDMVSEEEAPKSYAELADPKWKDKLAIASPNYGATQMIFAKGLLEIGGWELIDALAANNVLVGRGWPESQNAVVTGERAVAVDLSIRTFQALQKGADLGLVIPEEVVASYAVASIMADAAHPNAAKLFVEWRFSEEVESTLASSGSYPVWPEYGHPEGMPALDSMNLHYVNLDELVEEHADIKRRWTNTLER